MDAPKTPKLTPNSLALFTAYAKDAGNWSGTPLVGGNVRGSQELRGNLTQVKRAGLVETFRDEGNTWLTFTDAGIVFAASLGIDMRWIRDLGPDARTQCDALLGEEK